MAIVLTKITTLMKKISKIAICFSLTLLSFGQIMAQEQAKHELSVSGGLGLSSLKYDVSKGDHNQKLGGLLGIGYSYFFDERFSLNTGLEITLYNAEAKLNSFTDTYRATDTEGDFLFNTSVSDYKEKQRSVYMNIPIMVQYQHPVLEEHKFYVAAGGKIGIPLSGSYKTSGANFETTGTYDKLGEGSIISDLSGLGFYEFTGKKVNEDLDYLVSFMLSLETGMKWVLSPSMSLYTGVYFDYGLNDIRKGNNNQKFLAYQSPDYGVKAEDFKLSSILQSRYTENDINRSMAGKVMPVALGLKAKLAFSMP